MTTPQDYQCLAILQSIAASPHGQVIRTNNPAKARQVLYNFRKEFGDPTFADLQMRVSPDNTECEIWFIKKNSAPVVNIASMDLL